MNIISELSKSFKEHFPWKKCRIDCFVKMIVALLTVRTVSLTEWASVLLPRASTDSAYIRIKRFFRYFTLEGGLLARFIFRSFGFENGQWYLTLDRTNWEFGKFKINFLVLAMAYKRVAIPLMWTLLNKKGNPKREERIRLINRGCMTIKPWGYALWKNIQGTLAGNLLSFVVLLSVSHNSSNMSR